MTSGTAKRVVLVAVGSLALLAGGSHADTGATFVAVAHGVGQVPIIVSETAHTETRRAAKTLAQYIEKISGARPDVLTGVPEPVPDRAIWVGVQPPLSGFFPAVNFEFRHPEEILIVCNGRHLAIAGRDRVAGTNQIEFGTANAVYTFLQKHLDVRWLWPGPLGEDVVKRDTLAWAPFEYRFHPVFLQRAIFRRPGGAMLDWARAQRIALYSFRSDIGHAFDDWWDRYHAEHPEYFALQPDGTRSGFPDPGNAKLCEASPAVWAQWLANAEEALKKDETLLAINAAPNDGASAGLCVCDACRAWDDPDGPRYRLSWRGLSQEYVAMTDRYVRFWNTLAGLLKERFPGRDVCVSGLAYGPAKPPPVKAVPDPSILIGYVGHFPMAGEEVRAREKAEWLEWSGKAGRLMFRPNIFWYSGGWQGLPTLSTRATMEDFRFLAEHRGVGLAIDSTPQYWASQGPQYYAMAQFAWDPLQDGTALMEDYYRRGFGSAAASVRQYFDLMEEAHEAILNEPGWRHSMGVIKTPLTGYILDHYDAERLDRAEELLRAADRQAAGGPDVYRQRLAFVRTGLEFTRLLTETMRTMTLVRESSGKDAAAVRKAIELCEAREALFRRYDGLALSAHHFNVTWNRSRHMQDYIGPPSDTYRIAAGLLRDPQPVKAAEDAPGARAVPARPAGVFQPDAAGAGWSLAFQDVFNRAELGTNWAIVDGAWSVTNGALVTGGGTLVCTRSFPGLQRLEFDAVTAVKPFPFFGPDTPAVVQYSDMSSFIHGDATGIESGYFLQFGGFNNTASKLLRKGVGLVQASEPLIVPDREHHLVAEFDGATVRLAVDGKPALEYGEQEPLLGTGHERVGLFMWTGARIRNVKVYTKAP